MVGPAHLALLLLLLSCEATRAQSEDSCSLFRREYCNLRLDKILMLDTALTSPSQCQVRGLLLQDYNKTDRPVLFWVHYRWLAFIAQSGSWYFILVQSSSLHHCFPLRIIYPAPVSKSIIYRVLSLLKGAWFLQKLRCWRFIGCPCPCHPHLHTGSNHLCHLATPLLSSRVDKSFSELLCFWLTTDNNDNCRPFCLSIYPIISLTVESIRAINSF